MASANNPLFPLLISLLFFSFLCLCGDDLSSSSSLANDYPLSVEEIQLIIESHVQGNDLKRELITNEVLNMLFKTEEELTEDMSHYAEMDETDKKEILYLFFNRILPTILKYDSSRVKNGEKLIQGTDLLIEYYDEDSDTQYKEQTLKQKIENLLAGNNADRCVSCRTLKNLAIMMCAQNFPILPGRCVECSFLRNLTNVMCNLTCNVLPNTNIPCVTCGVWYQSIYMLCGAPNCSCGNYYGLEKSQSESLFKRSNEFDSFNALSCVPCYNMWLGYQFLCNDLYSYCPATPTPTPSPSPPPNPSNYNYYQYK